MGRRAAIRFRHLQSLPFGGMARRRRDARCQSSRQSFQRGRNTAVSCSAERILRSCLGCHNCPGDPRSAGRPFICPCTQVSRRVHCLSCQTPCQTPRHKDHIDPAHRKAGPQLMAVPKDLRKDKRSYICLRDRFQKVQGTMARPPADA